MRELDSKMRGHVQMLHRKRVAVRKNKVERISGGRRKIEGEIQAKALEDMGWQPEASDQGLGGLQRGCHKPCVLDAVRHGLLSFSLYQCQMTERLTLKASLTSRIIDCFISNQGSPHFTVHGQFEEVNINGDDVDVTLMCIMPCMADAICLLLRARKHVVRA